MSEPSYACGLATQPLLGMTIGEALRATVERWPDRDGLVVPHQRYRATYRALWEQTEGVARGLLGLGVKKGDRVGVWSPNRFEWVLLQLATSRVGAVLVNVNPAYRSSELRYALRQSGVSHLFLAERFRDRPYLPILESVRDDLADLKHALVIDRDWEKLLEAGSEVPASEVQALEATLHFDEPINIQYTSGTTGAPKGATLSHHNILNNAYFVGQTLKYTEQDRVCIPVPFYHCFGMVMGNLACVLHGSTMVVPGESFDPDAVIAAVEQERCTSLYGVPTMFIGVLNSPRREGADLSSLRTGIMAGSPCPIEVMKQTKDLLHMKEVTICYGMTETSPVSTQTAVDDPLDKQVGTVGRVHPHVGIKIVDPDTGRVVPRGERGELCTRGYSVMLGYWKAEEATRQAIDAARWMHTGDLATMDELGYIRIVGRIKDMIIRGGENIYPREIEEFLYGHPEIEDVQVIGVPSSRYGEEVMAWIKPKEGHALAEADLDAFCRGQIATYKIPRYWKIVDSFPMTVTGKIQKYKMRETAIAELGLSAPGDT